MEYKEFLKKQQEVLPFKFIPLVGQKTIKNIYFSPYSSKFKIIEFTDGTAVYLKWVIGGILEETYCPLINVSVLDGQLSVYLTDEAFNLRDAKILNQSQLDELKRIGEEYGKTLLEETRREEIKKLKERIKILEENV